MEAEGGRTFANNMDDLFVEANRWAAAGLAGLVGLPSLEVVLGLPKWFDWVSICSGMIGILAVVAWKITEQRNEEREKAQVRQRVLAYLASSGCDSAT